jgi:hypothetical protein
MKKEWKVIVTGAVFLAVALFSCIRIIYINTEKYPKIVQNSYCTGEAFTYNGMQIEVLDAQIYSDDKLKEKYQMVPDEAADACDIVIELKLKNISETVQECNIAGFTMQNGIEPIGSENPYLFSYLNPGQSGTVTLEPAEEDTVFLAFPLESGTEKSGLKLILALYPEKCEVVL